MSLLRRIGRHAREGRMLAWGLLHQTHPILAHIVPIRRCNIDCSYCNEYDKVSDPVPLATMLRRVDKLAELGTAIVTNSGGEPMMHPDLDSIIARIRERGMLAGLITNGYFLSPKRIESLNRVGLDYLQISIDNVEPDETSKKSLRLLQKKLECLRDYARFQVNINSVLGSGVKNPEDARTICTSAEALGFSTSVGIIHNGSGQLRPLTSVERSIFDHLSTRGRGSYTRIRSFQRNLAEGKTNDWRCRAGARYLYICELGLVHYCSQQRGYPAVPLESYTVDDIRREFDTPKSCAPLCTVGCVHRVATLDNWRSPQLQSEAEPHQQPAFLTRLPRATGR